MKEAPKVARLSPARPRQRMRRRRASRTHATRARAPDRLPPASVEALRTRKGTERLLRCARCGHSPTGGRDLWPLVRKGRVRKLPVGSAAAPPAWRRMCSVPTAVARSRMVLSSARTAAPAWGRQVSPPRPGLASRRGCWRSSAGEHWWWPQLWGPSSSSLATMTTGAGGPAAETRRPPWPGRRRRKLRLRPGRRNPQQ